LLPVHRHPEILQVDLVEIWRYRQETGIWIIGIPCNKAIHFGSAALTSSCLSHMPMSRNSGLSRSVGCDFCARGTSSIWNLDFRIGAGLCSTHSSHDPINVLLHHRPSRIAQDHNRNDTLREILLITNVLVGC
jgi:hypothetical protein